MCQLSRLYTFLCLFFNIIRNCSNCMMHMYNPLQHPLNCLSLRMWPEWLHCLNYLSYWALIIVILTGWNMLCTFKSHILYILLVTYTYKSQEMILLCWWHIIAHWNKKRMSARECNFRLGFSASIFMLIIYILSHVNPIHVSTSVIDVNYWQQNILM